MYDRDSAKYLQRKNDGDSVSDTVSASAAGTAAVEGHSVGQATASVRSMKRAKGNHKGINATVTDYVTTETSWKK